MTPVPAKSPATLPKTFEPDLVALRGFAAVLVCLFHAVGRQGLLTQGDNPTRILEYQVPGHFCVLLFFVLSGYVVGLNTPSRLTPATVGTYIQKRFLRLYPIYAVCLVLALLVAGAGTPSWKAILGNFLFLHVVRVATIDELAPAWSLQYEVVLYLLFIPVSFFRFPAWRVAVGCLALGLLNMYVRPAAPLLSSYAFSFLFWCAGLALAHQAPRWPRRQPEQRVLLSVLLLLLSFPNFSLDWLLTTGLVKLGGHDLTYQPGLDMFESQVGPHDLAYLPFAVLGVVVFTRQHFPLRPALLPVAFLVGGLGFLPLFTDGSFSNHPGYVLSSKFYLASVGVYVTHFAFIERLAQVLLAWLTKVGIFSYALYLVHFPILCAFQRLPYFAGSTEGYWVRCIVFLLVSFYTASLLEWKFQPWARAFLERSLWRLRK
jgi:peptidoglycan/LPS O-acetylase OafA/YrhL